MLSFTEMNIIATYIMLFRIIQSPFTFAFCTKMYYFNSMLTADIIAYSVFVFLL